MTPSELKALLEPFGIRPLKARGQHFLLDENVVRTMVEAADVREGDPVIEIGPGPGILTEALLAAGADLVAVELDMRLQALLEKRFSDRPFRLVRGDILSFTNGSLVEHFRDPPRAARDGYRVVANLPYAITSRILEKFLVEEPRARSMTVMVQKEVAERVSAEPGAMSALAVFVQTLAKARVLTKVPRSAFSPPPKVDSAVIHMERRTDLSPASFGGADQGRYFSIVRAGFAAPRKKLRNTVRRWFSSEADMEKTLEKAKISGSARPAELSVAQWQALVAAMPQAGEK